jgi:Uma2 family endonuclease
MPEGEGKRELVRGEVVEWMPVGGLHGDVVLELAVRLRRWAQQGRHDYLGAEVGYRLHRNPDSVRAADISFVKLDRMPETGIPEGFIDFAPDLAVEVVSPFETA